MFQFILQGCVCVAPVVVNSALAQAVVMLGSSSKEEEQEGRKEKRENISAVVNLTHANTQNVVTSKYDTCFRNDLHNTTTAPAT